MTTRLRRLICRHDWHPIRLIRDGVTLDWGARVAPAYRRVSRCERCGKERTQIGPYIVPGNHLLT
jgi:hypothetical protein